MATKISQYPRNADNTPMDLEVGVLTDTSGNGGARLTTPPVGPDNSPIDAKGLVLVDTNGDLITTAATVMMALSLFTAAPTKAVPLGINTVQTAGYSQNGLGAATYVNDDVTVTPAYVAANPATSFITKNNRGFKLLADGPIGLLTPHVTGALGGYDDVPTAFGGVDDTVAINTLLAYWKNNPTCTPDFGQRYWTITGEITIQMLVDGNSNGTRDMRQSARLFAGSFVAKTGSAGARMVTINAAGVHIMGTLGAVGCGDATGNCITYNNRSWDYGIYLVDSQSIRIDSWYAANVKRWGFDQTTEDFAHLGDQTNNNGSNIGVWVGPGNIFNCGSAGGQANASNLTYTISTVSKTNVSGNVSQTTIIGFVETLDSKIQSGDDFAYTDTLGNHTCYTVKTVIDTHTLEFYGWMPSTVAATQVMYSCHGGGLNIHGNNGGMSEYGRVTGIRAGVAVRDCGLYGSRIGDVHVEAVGLLHVLGTPPNGASIGGYTNTLHSESGYLLLVHRSISPSGRWIGTSSANGVGIVPSGVNYWQSFYHQRPRYTDDKQSFNGSHGIVVVDGNGTINQNLAGPNQYENANSAITISNRPHEQYYRSTYLGAATPTVTLKWYPEFNDLWTGRNWMGFEMQGSQANRNGMTQVTVALDATTFAGWTINGVAGPLVYTNTPGPCRGVALLDVANKNVRFVFTVDRGYGYVGITTQGDTSPSLAPDTATQTQIFNTPLTANRNVTLSTTFARNGDKFRIVRTAAATGAFNLNVGTGPLKALGIGSWCEVEYDGTAWQLTAYGTL